MDIPLTRLSTFGRPVMAATTSMQSITIHLGRVAALELKIYVSRLQTTCATGHTSFANHLAPRLLRFEVSFDQVLTARCSCKRPSPQVLARIGTTPYIGALPLGGHEGDD